MPPDSALLVLLPGLDGSGELLSEFIEALAGSFDTQLIVYPSHGGQSYTELAAFVLRQLPAARPLILLGESFGGPLALLLAAQCRDKLLAVVLCASFARFPSRALRMLAPLSRLAPVRLAPRPLLSWFLLGRWSSAHWLDRLAAVLARVPASVLQARAQAALEVDAMAALAALSVPLLALRARHDRVVPPGATGALRAGTSHLQVVDIDAPHFLLQAAPAECAAALRTFLSRL